MQNLKLVSIEKSKPFTTSLIIAEGTELQHESVMRLLEKHKDSPTLAGFEIGACGSKKNPEKMANLNEKQATFLVTLMRNTPKVVQFKAALVEEFFSQRKRLSDMGNRRKDTGWIEARTVGKIAHRNLTDKIKEFTEYAAKQNSENSLMYFVVIPKMINRRLFDNCSEDFATLRQFLTPQQLIHIATAEKAAIQGLDEGMSQELEYKEVYKLADKKVSGFAVIIGVSEIMGVLPEQFGLLK